MTISINPNAIQYIADGAIRQHVCLGATHHALSILAVFFPPIRTSSLGAHSVSLGA